MKKFIALLLCAVILFMPYSAFAGELDFLKNDTNNVTYTATFGFTLDKPLEILSVLEENGMLGELGNHVNLKLLGEGIFDSATQYDVKLDMSSDFRKIKMEILTDSTLPLDINPGLSIDVSTKQGVWLDLDFTDLENPEFEIITLSPSYNNKYVRTTDKDEIIPNMLLSIPDELTKILTPAFFERIQEKSIELIAEYGDITRAGNSYTIRFSDESFKKLLFAIIEEITEEFSDYFPEISDADLSAAKGILDGINILGKDGFTVTYNLKNGKIDTMEEKFSIDLNLYDIASYIGEDIPEFLTKENSTIAFTATATASFSGFGSTSVTFPELTEENTYKAPVYESYDYEYEPMTAWSVRCKTKDFVYRDGSLMVPFRELVEDYLYDFEYGTDYTIEYRDGIIYFTCGKIGIDELAFVTYKGDCWLNGVKHEYHPSVNIEGITFVESRMMEEVFGWVLAETGYDYISSQSFVLYRC